MRPNYARILDFIDAQRLDQIRMKLSNLMPITIAAYNDPSLGACEYRKVGLKMT